MTQPRDFDYEAWELEGTTEARDEQMPASLDELLDSDDELFPPDPVIDER